MTTRHLFDREALIQDDCTIDDAIAEAAVAYPRRKDALDCADALGLEVPA